MTSDKSLLQQIDQDADSFFEFLSIHDEVKKAILQLEFRSLESLRQFLFGGFLYDPWSGEAYQSARFGNVEIPQHSK